MSRRSHALQVRERLSDRDLAILGSLRQLRLLTGKQLRRLHFPGGQTITRGRKMRTAVTRLLSLRLVVRLSRRVGGVRAGSEGQVIGLSGLGHAVLDVGDHNAPRRRGVSDTKLAFQSHVLAVSELHVSLAEHERAGHAELLEFAAEPGCWRRFSGIGGQRITLKPDAYLRLGVGEYELSSFIEQDMATESLPTISRKLGVYVSYWRTGHEQHEHGVFPLVWWLVPDVARLEAITAAIRRLPQDTRGLFTVALTGEAPSRLVRLHQAGGGL